LTERAEFIATIDLKQVDAALEKTRAQTSSLGGGMSSLQGSLDRVDKAASRSVQQGIGSLSFALGGTAGQAAGLLDGIGDVAGALAGGGAFGLALATAAAALSFTADRFDWLGTKAAEATKKATEHFDDLKKEIKDLDDALIAMATGTTIQRVKQQAITAEKELAARQAIEAVGGADKFARLVGYEAQGVKLPRMIQNAYDAAILATKEFTLENDKLTKSIRNSQFERHLQEVAEQALEAGRTASGKPKGDVVTGGGGSSQAILDETERASIIRQDAEQARYKDELDAGERRLEANTEMQRKWVDIELSAANAVEAIKDKALKDDLERGQKESDARRAIAAEALNLGVSSAQSLTDALITGQDNALEHFAASIAKQAGSAMIGHGINAAAGGLAMLSLGNPAGAAGLATGVALIGGGLALGGVGTGIEHTLAGGEIGKALPTKGAGAEAAMRDRGIDDRQRGGGSSSRGGGALTVVNNYNVGGPLAEDSARASHDLWKLQQRRRIRG